MRTAELLLVTGENKGQNRENGISEMSVFNANWAMTVFIPIQFLHY